MELIHDILFIKENSRTIRERRDSLTANYYVLFDNLIAERKLRGASPKYERILAMIMKEEERIFYNQELLFEMNAGYRTTRLLENYFHEIEHNLFDYLSPAEVDKFRVNINPDGFFLSNEGRPLGVNLETYARYDFVLTQDGKLYMRDSSMERKGVKGKMRMNHSSFFRGLPVAAAGEFAIKDAQLLGLSGLSGHYLPDDEFFQQIKAELKKRNVDLSFIKVLWSIPDPEN